VKEPGLIRLRDEGVQWREIDGEVVALEGGTSTYVVANRSGALLWQALARGSSRPELVARLVETYDIDAARAESDVESFLAELTARGLLEA
jgi:Coenzyme PQQ synthesis protein D (PqqD)